MKDITIQTYNQIFWDMATKYDTTNSNILRKIIHSYSVAENCFKIACKFKLDKKERELCYLMGLFHDIGRFEQWKLYQTYNDKLSVDHGDLGAEILSKLNCDLFDISKEDFVVMINAIKYHTKPYDGSDEKIKFYNEIIKNADALANVITTANGAQQMTVDADGVSQQILEDFKNLKPLWIYSPKTKLDRALMLTACSYYVKFEFLRREILQNNYIDIMFQTFSQYLNDEDKQKYKQAVDTLKDKLISY